MKKRIFCLLFTLTLFLALAVPAFAEASLDYVTDPEGYLSDEEFEQLNTRARTISEQNNCGVYIIIVDEYLDYNGSDDGIYEFAKYLYKEHELGLGEDQSGELLVMSMDDRQYALIAYGAVGNGAFTDYGKEQLTEAFLDDFKNDDWYGGYCDYLSVSKHYLDLYQAGTAYDIHSESTTDTSAVLLPPVVILAIFVVSFLIALIVCLCMLRKMRTAVQATQANDYILPDGVVIIRQDDIYTHTTQTRETISDSSDSDSGGTTVDSDGFSGSSGSF